MSSNENKKQVQNPSQPQQALQQVQLGVNIPLIDGSKLIYDNENLRMENEKLKIQNMELVGKICLSKEKVDEMSTRITNQDTEILDLRKENKENQELKKRVDELEKHEKEKHERALMGQLAFCL